VNDGSTGQPGTQNALERELEEQKLNARMRDIGLKVLVLSGKGGVGKSTVAANLAVSLSKAGRKVGLLDVDVHGPSIPKLMGLEGRRPRMDGAQLQPLPVTDNLTVMSIAFLLDDPGEAVIWRGPLKYNAIRQFLTDVAWGRLDYLVIDSPPGTGDEPLSVAQLVGSPAAAVVVTTPQDLAISDVRRCVSFCRKLSLPIVGIVENMSGLVCPHCGQPIDLFKTGGGQALAEEAEVPLLGRIPIDPQIVTSGDAGTPFVEADTETPSTRAFADVVRGVLEWPGQRGANSQDNTRRRTIT
jgi:ATP-binding protein involved in chromosome partitioning